LKEVIVKFKAYKAMIKFFSQFSSNKISRDKWVESMGYLFCRIEGDYYIIEDAYGITSGTELDVQVSPMTLSNIDQLIHEHDGDFIGGWWHTHPGLSPFFSETDIKNQVFYQSNNPDGLGIVFDHSMIDKDYIGFQIFRLIHQFSEEYVEVPFQLQGFTKDGIKECMALLGIDADITQALIEKYGDKGASIVIDFSKLGDYLGDDPIGDAEWSVMDAEELLKQDKIIDAIKQYKLAANILQNTKYFEEFAKILHILMNLCISNNYIENAKAEFLLFQNLKGKISTEKFKTISNEIRLRIQNA